MAAPAAPERTPRSRAEEEAGAAMSFFDHLVELRKRMISALIAVGVGMVVGLTGLQALHQFHRQPMLDALRANHLEDKLYYTNPAGYVGLYINLGLYLGVVLAMPWVLYQMWLFVAPGLYKHERRAAASFIVSAMFLFLCGIAFGYYVMLPQVLTYVVAFANGGSVGQHQSADRHQRIFQLDTRRAGGPGSDFRTARGGLYPVALRHRHAEISAYEFPLRDAADHGAAAIVTPTPDATTMLDFHGADDRAVFRQRAGVVCGPAPQARQGAR